jgi:hypothetical protein
MAKNQATATAHGKRVTRDRAKVSGSSLSGRFKDKGISSRSKDARPEILFPTEPTSIPREEIDRAVELVISRRK